MEEQNELLRKLVSKDKNENQPIKETEAKSVTVRRKKDQKDETISIIYWKEMKDYYNDNDFEIIEFHD
jgi:hypothetical protein